MANARVGKVLAKKCGIGQWSFVGPGSEKKWYSAENSPQGAWDHIADEMLLEFARRKRTSYFSVQRLHCPGVFSRAKDMENCQCTSLQIIHQLKQFFASFLPISSVSTEQWRLCEEFESHQDGSGEPDVLIGQSIVLGEIKAEIPLQNENSSNHQILWQQYMERIESLTPESKVSRFCMEVGFMRIVEVGQISRDQGHW